MIVKISKKRKDGKFLVTHNFPLSNRQTKQILTVEKLAEAIAKEKANQS